MRNALHPTEAQLTKAIRYYLRAKNIFHWKNWSGLGSAPGIPDILGVLPGGKALMIEVKARRGKLSPAQQQFLEAARERGALAFVARSITDLQEQGL